MTHKCFLYIFILAISNFNIVFSSECTSNYLKKLSYQPNFNNCDLWNGNFFFNWQKLFNNNNFDSFDSKMNIINNLELYNNDEQNYNIDINYYNIKEDNSNNIVKPSMRSNNFYHFYSILLNKNKLHNDNKHINNYNIFKHISSIYCNNKNSNSLLINNIEYNYHQTYLKNILHQAKYNKLIQIIKKTKTHIMKNPFRDLVLYAERKKLHTTIDLINKTNEDKIANLKFENKNIESLQEKIKNLEHNIHNLEQHNKTKIETFRNVNKEAAARMIDCFIYKINTSQIKNTWNTITQKSSQKEINNLQKKIENIQEQNNHHEAEIKTLKKKKALNTIFYHYINKIKFDQQQYAFNKIKKDSSQKKINDLQKKIENIQEQNNKHEAKINIKDNIFNNLKILQEDNKQINFLKYIPGTKERKKLQANNNQIDNLEETLLTEIKENIDLQISVFKNNENILNKLICVYKSLSYIEKTSIVIINTAIIAIIIYLIYNKEKSIFLNFLTWNKLPLFGGSIGGLIGIVKLFFDKNEYNENKKKISCTTCTKCQQPTNKNRMYCFNCGGIDDSIILKV